MSQFHPADASNFARLCMTAMATKSTPAQIKKAAGDAKRAHLPPQNAGLYTGLVKMASECGITASDRLIVAQAAYAVAMDLLINVAAFSQRANLEAAVSAASHRLAPPSPPCAKHGEVAVEDGRRGRSVASTRSLNGYVRDDDDGDDDPEPPSPYPSHAARAAIANVLDEQEETRRALTGAAA
jgi:hypothetical protein